EIEVRAVTIRERRHVQLLWLMLRCLVFSRRCLESLDKRQSGPPQLVVELRILSQLHSRQRHDSASRTANGVGMPEWGGSRTGLRRSRVGGGDREFAAA